MIVDINIDEAVAFTHFAGTGRDDIHRTPDQISDQIYMMFNCFFKALNMFFVIFNTVRIVDLIVL